WQPPYPLAGRRTTWSPGKISDRPLAPSLPQRLEGRGRVGAWQLRAGRGPVVLLRCQRDLAGRRRVGVQTQAFEQLTPLRAKRLKLLAKRGLRDEDLLAPFTRDEAPEDELRRRQRVPRDLLDDGGHEGDELLDEAREHRLLLQLPLGERRIRQPRGRQLGGRRAHLLGEADEPRHVLRGQVEGAGG